MLLSLVTVVQVATAILWRSNTRLGGSSALLADMTGAVVVGLPGAAQDHLSADVPGARPSRPGVPAKSPRSRSILAVCAVDPGLGRAFEAGTACDLLLTAVLGGQEIISGEPPCDPQRCQLRAGTAALARHRHAHLASRWHSDVQPGSSGSKATHRTAKLSDAVGFFRKLNQINISSRDRTRTYNLPVNRGPVSSGDTLRLRTRSARFTCIKACQGLTRPW
jgi:hypothetical protein